MCIEDNCMLNRDHYARLGLDRIYDRILGEERLDRADGLALFACPDLTAVGALADYVRRKKHGVKTHYVINRQINYTNVCVNDCVFCAFRRDDKNEPGAFVLSREQILKRIEDAGASLDEVHIVGGCHPELPLEWFEDLLREIGASFPDLPIKAFTPVEIAHFAKMAGITTKETLKRLARAGLAMMPGGGAEIFAPRLRKKLCPAKADAATWLAISGEAHSLGIKTNCTMLFGHLESHEDRVGHLLALRDQQDASGGFTCFIPLPFLKKNNSLSASMVKNDFGDGLDRLRTIAVSRLLLDNIPHIKAYWVMLGPKLAQTALHYGADDLDGTIVEEKIGHMAGANSAQAMTVPELEWMISQSGFVPVRRNALFETV